MQLARDLATVLIQAWEGYREFAYPDPASPLARATPVARWGHVPAQEILEMLPGDTAGLPGDPWTVGHGETGKHVGPSTRWSRAVANANFDARLEDLQWGVRRMLRVAALPWEEAAFLSFAWNVGLDDDADHKAEGFGDSTLLRLFNAGDKAGCALQFYNPKTGDSPWDNAGGVRDMQGLRNRRRAERAMFLGLHPAIERT